MSTPAGDVELSIPKLRSGTFYPSVLERRRRIDRAVFAVVMEAYVPRSTTHERTPTERSNPPGAEQGERHWSRVLR